VRELIDGYEGAEDFEGANSYLSFSSSRMGPERKR
jgi:hypothetical protein